MKESAKNIIAAAAGFSFPAPEPKLLTKAEMATALRMSPRTLNNLMKQRLIPYIKIGDGKQADVRFSFQAVVDTLGRRFGVESQ